MPPFLPDVVRTLLVIAPKLTHRPLASSGKGGVDVVDDCMTNAEIREKVLYYANSAGDGAPLVTIIPSPAAAAGEAHAALGESDDEEQGESSSAALQLEDDISPEADDKLMKLLSLVEGLMAFSNAFSSSNSREDSDASQGDSLQTLSTSNNVTYHFIKLPAVHSPPTPTAADDDYLQCIVITAPAPPEASSAHSSSRRAAASSPSPTDTQVDAAALKSLLLSHWSLHCHRFPPPSPDGRPPCSLLVEHLTSGNAARLVELRRVARKLRDELSMKERGSSVGSLPDMLLPPSSDEASAAAAASRQAKSKMQQDRDRRLSLIHDSLLPDALKAVAAKAAESPVPAIRASVRLVLDDFLYGPDDAAAEQQQQQQHQLAGRATAGGGHHAKPSARPRGRYRASYVHAPCRVRQCGTFGRGRSAFLSPDGSSAALGSASLDKDPSAPDDTSDVSPLPPPAPPSSSSSSSSSFTDDTTTSHLPPQPSPAMAFELERAVDNFVREVESRRSTKPKGSTTVAVGGAANAPSPVQQKSPLLRVAVFLDGHLMWGINVAKGMKDLDRSAYAAVHDHIYDRCVGKPVAANEAGASGGIYASSSSSSTASSSSSSIASKAKKYIKEIRAASTSRASSEYSSHMSMRSTETASSPLSSSSSASREGFIGLSLPPSSPFSSHVVNVPPFGPVYIPRYHSDDSNEKPSRVVLYQGGSSLVSFLIFLDEDALRHVHEEDPSAVSLSGLSLSAPPSSSGLASFDSSTAGHVLRPIANALSTVLTDMSSVLLAASAAPTQRSAGSLRLPLGVTLLYVNHLDHSLAFGANTGPSASFPSSSSSSQHDGSQFEADGHHRVASSNFPGLDTDAIPPEVRWAMDDACAEMRRDAVTKSGAAGDYSDVGLLETCMSVGKHGWVLARRLGHREVYLLFDDRWGRHSNFFEVQDAAQRIFKGTLGGILV